MKVKEEKYFFNKGKWWINIKVDYETAYGTIYYVQGIHGFPRRYVKPYASKCGAVVLEIDKNGSHRERLSYMDHDGQRHWILEKGHFYGEEEVNEAILRIRVAELLYKEVQGG